MSRYYMSLSTGEIVETLDKVIKTVIENIVRFHFLDLRWSIVMI